jgi:cell division protein FtsQ
LAISTRLHADRSIRSRLRLPFERRGRRRAEGRRRSPLLVVAGVTVAFVALATGLLLVSRSAWFDVRTVEVRGGSHLSRDELVDLAAIQRGTSTMWFDGASLERRLEDDPWVAEATVAVSWPHTVSVSVTERRPVAVAVDGSARELIAADGTRLGPDDDSRDLPKILLAGVAPDDVPALVSGAARAVDALPPAVARTVDRVVAQRDGSLDLRLLGRTVVAYGAPGGERQKAIALGQVLRWASRDGETVARISLAAPGIPAVIVAG